MDLSGYFSLIQSAFMLVLVIGVAYFSLKLANKYMTKSNKMIKVVERVSVNNNSSLSVVDICGTYYLMSFTGSDNKILKELDSEEVKTIIENNDSIDINKLFDIKKRLNNCLGMRGKID